MFRSAAIVIASLVFGLSVLFTSIFRTASPQYAFSQAGVLGTQTESQTLEVDYYLPYPGILPDHFLWPLKALRDKVWLFVLRDPGRKAEVLLLFADKRVGMARELIKGGKPELGVSTLTKGEKYLEQVFLEAEKAQDKKIEMGQFFERLGTASLKHQEVIESLMPLVSEDARPVLNQTLDYPKRVYEKTAQKLNELGRPVPTVPAPSPSPTPKPSKIR